jgi:hypothetical protein
VDEFDLKHLNALADKIEFVRDFQNLLAKYDVRATIDIEVCGDACAYGTYEFDLVQNETRGWGYITLCNSPDEDDFKALLDKFEVDLNDYESLCVNHLLRKEQAV